MAWLGTGINEDADLGLRQSSDQATHGVQNTHLKYLANGVEEPTVRINLLLILRLDDEDNRHRDEVSMVVTVRKDELWRRINGQLGCVLK